MHLTVEKNVKKGHTLKNTSHEIINDSVHRELKGKEDIPNPLIHSDDVNHYNLLCVFGPVGRSEDVVMVGSLRA